MAEGEREGGVGDEKVSIHRLPKPASRLFGRAADIAWLDACWAERAHVATIVAAGGIGKSALVWDWLRGVQADGWRGAERVLGWSFRGQGTDRASTSDELVDMALRWFGDPDPSAGSPWDRGERLAALFRKQRTILVLDGMEPLQRGTGAAQGKIKDPALQVLLKELGAHNTGLCLITTRLHVTDLDGLEGGKAKEHRLDPLSVEAGVELLEARGAKGSKEALRAAATEYEGHGLALTLLGSYVRRAHKGDIGKRDQVPPLAGKPAQRVMAAYEKWFSRKPEVAVLRTLGLFDRPARDDETAVLRDSPKIRGITAFLEGPPRPPLHAWEKAVATLRDVGLVMETAGDTLDTHPMVREHFADLVRREHPDAWREGHRRLGKLLQGKAKERPETVEEMTPLYDAVMHKCLAGEHQDASDVYWKRIRRIHERHNWQKLGAFESEIAVLSAFFDPPWERFAPGVHYSLPAFLVNHVPALLGALGRLSEAEGLLRMGIDRAVAAKEWANGALLAANLAEILLAGGRLRDAEEQARKGVEIADNEGNAHWHRTCTPMRAAALHAMGLQDEAAAEFELAERSHAAAFPSLKLLTSISGYLYCDLLLDQGRDVEVRTRAATFFAGRLPDVPTLDTALEHLSFGRAHLLAAQHGAAFELATAASHITTSVDALRRAGHHEHLPRALLARAALHTHTRAFDLARKDLDEALTLAARCGFRLHACDAHLGLARLAVAGGDPAGARPHAERARQLIDETGYHRRDGKLGALDAACRAQEG